MNPLLSHIDKSMHGGELIPFQPMSQVSVGSLSYKDILRPYIDVFGGSSRPAEFKSPTIYQGPRFRPEPKRTLRPLSMPKTSFEPPVKEDFLPLWKSLQAVLDYYREEGMETPSLDAVLSSKDAVEPFFASLADKLSEYWPLDGWFECGISEFNNVLEMPYIPLYLPFYHYDEYGSSSKVAFLEGPSSVAGTLEQIYSEDEDLKERLDSRDRELIAKLDWMKLVETYGDSKLEKICDLKGLENFGETFFGAISRKYDFYEELDPIIAGADCTEVIIESSDHIRFAIDYCEAWYEMEDANPGGYGFETEGEAIPLMRDILRIYRMENGLELIEYAEEETESDTASDCDWLNDEEEEDYDSAA